MNGVVSGCKKHNKRKLFKKEYLYTMELKKSGVAKQLIAISNKMNK